MKKSLLLIFSLFTIYSFAEQVDVNAAKQIAQNHVSLLMPTIRGEVNDAVLVHTFKVKTNSQQEKAALYAFDVNGGAGFVLVAGDDIIIPVLGYSDEGSFGNINSGDFPRGLKKLIGMYQQEIKRLMDENTYQSEEVKAMWKDYATGQIAQSKASVLPLITTKWTQRNSYGYNDLCPGGSPTGCVATAFAQILKYYNHPAQGVGFHSYNHSTYGTLSANFGATTYDWANMPDQLTSSSTQAQKDAIAALMYHCGVSVNMNYSPSGSGASSSDVDDAMEDYFSYKTSAQYISRSSYTLAAWKNKIKLELDNSRVVYHKGFCPNPSAGHAFVIDGYDETDKFHLNWGWGGSYNGYFEIDNLNPGSTYTWNQAQGAIIGIDPLNSSYDLKLNSSLSISPSPIVRGQSASISTTIRNSGGAAYNGQLAAFLFDAVNGSMVDTIQIVNQSISAGSNVSITFSHSGLPATPANYTVGIYYKNQAGNWTLVSPGTYVNPIGTQVVSTTQDLRAFQNISILTSDPIEQNQPVQLKFVFKNKVTTSAFNGLVSIDLHKANGEWIQEIESKTITINPNGTKTEYFNSTGLNVNPGSYRLVVWYQHPTNGWQIVESTATYLSSRSVDIVGLDFANNPIDPYEDNNTQSTAYEFPVTFSGNTFNVNTAGSNIHDTVDYDFYKIVLPTGGSYSVDIMAHDEYNSTVGYTNDVMYRVWDSQSNEWSEYYDDVSPTLSFSNWTAVYIEVIPYYYGDLGSYELDINVTHNGAVSGIETLSENSVDVYPNPAKDFVYVNTSTELQKIEIRNQLGQVVMVCPDATNGVDISTLSTGVYNLTIYSEEGQLTKKIIKK